MNWGIVRIYVYDEDDLLIRAWALYTQESDLRDVESVFKTQLEDILWYEFIVESKFATWTYKISRTDWREFYIKEQSGTLRNSPDIFRNLNFRNFIGSGTTLTFDFKNDSGSIDIPITLVASDYTDIDGVVSALSSQLGTDYFIIKSGTSYPNYIFITLKIIPITYRDDFIGWYRTENPEPRNDTVTGGTYTFSWNSRYWSKPEYTWTTYEWLETDLPPDLSFSDNVWLDIDWWHLYWFYNMYISDLWVLMVHWSDDPGRTFFLNKDWSVEATTHWFGTRWIIYNGKTIFWNDYDDIITFSKTYDPSTDDNELVDFSWYSAWSQSVSGWNKWAITWFTVWENWLYIFKSNEIWYTNSEKDDWTTFNFIFRKISSNWAVNQSSIVQVDQDIFYFDYENRSVRRLSYERDFNTLRDTAISRDIEDVLKEIPNSRYRTDYKSFINMNYSYPYLEINFPDRDAIEKYLDFNDYYIPNRTFVYNVDNKSWTERTDKIDNDDGYWPIASSNQYWWGVNWEIYNSLPDWGDRSNPDFDDIYTQKEWVYLSKEYTFWDERLYKKFWWLDIRWRLYPSRNAVISCRLEILIDWVVVEMRLFVAEYSEEVTEINEKIQLYNIWQKIQFRLKHNSLTPEDISHLTGPYRYETGKVEIFSVTPYLKATDIQPADFY